MSLVDFSAVMEACRKRNRAAGAFNILNQLSAMAVVRAAEERGVPVILQTSVSTVEQLGAETIVGFVRPLAEGASVPVALHLDHATSVALCRRCIDAGWTSVMYDGSKQDYEANLAATRQVAEYAHPRGAGVEGELGAIVGIEDGIYVSKDEAALADPQLAEDFVRRTGIDALAPAIGTAHGLYALKPEVRFDLFEEIAGRVRCHLVVHGGTGLAPAAFRRLVALGAAKVNVSTALKRAYLDGMRVALEADGGRYNPLEADRVILDHMERTVREHLDFFTAKPAGKE